MLILSRKIDESVVIADDIKVTILSIAGKQVRLGIEAPTNVTVNREEIHLKIKESLPARSDADYSGNLD